MTDEEKKRRKMIWDSMTDEERQAANRQLKSIFVWCSKETEKAWEKINADGRYLGGLDGYYPEMIEISKERDRKIEKLWNRIFGEETIGQK